MKAVTELAVTIMLLLGSGEILKEIYLHTKEETVRVMKKGLSSTEKLSQALTSK